MGMDTDFVFSNKKIYGLIGLYLFLDLCFFIFFFHTFRNVDLAFDTIFTSIIMVIGMVTIIITIPVLTIYIWRHFKYWPIRISLSKKVLKFEYIILDDLLINIENISIIYALRRKDYYPWYDYFMVIKTKEQNLLIIVYLQSNLIKALFELNNLSMVKIEETRFIELEHEARMQKNNS